jgi:hypothetical protein
MELHATYKGDRTLAAVGIVYGLVAGVVGGLFAWGAGRPTAISWVVWISGGFFFLVGCYVLATTLRPFRIAFSDAGLSVRSEGHVFEGPWDQVDAIGISTLPALNENQKDRHHLVLWVPRHVKMRHAASYPTWSQTKGHVLIELNNLRETPEQVAEILRKYAGEKFRLLA